MHRLPERVRLRMFQEGTVARGYVITSGVLFALLVVAHILRILAEGIRTAGDPFFLAMTVLGAGMAVWAWRVLRAPGPR